GPADWQLMIVTDHRRRWDGLTWLPHGEDVGRVPLIATTAEVAELIGRVEDDPRHLVVVTDRPDLLSVRTSPLRRLIAGERSCAVVVVCADEAALPSVATSALVVGSRG
ncbi:MAG TPA: hypothetical protein PLV68_02645, partial [Ilumatobacteraceae bacterium]|nr:hypothetical protein [Ilumatobacteraceae bacterium]